MPSCDATCKPGVHSQQAACSVPCRSKNIHPVHLDPLLACTHTALAPVVPEQSYLLVYMSSPCNTKHLCYRKACSRGTVENNTENVSLPTSHSIQLYLYSAVSLQSYFRALYTSSRTRPHSWSQLLPPRAITEATVVRKNCRTLPPLN